MYKHDFSDQSRYNRMFHKVLYKGGDSAMNYIKIFHHSKTLWVSVGNCYTEDQIMYTFLDNFQQGGNYSFQIASHQA